MKTQKKIRVLLADDHSILREGLRTLLAREPDIEVVADVADGRAAIEKTRDLAPDVIVIDIAMPDLNGIEATRRIRSDLFGAKVLCLSVHREMHMIDAMLEAGASGYVLKTSASAELVEAVRTVAAGGTYLTPLVAGDVVERHVRGNSSPDTPRSHRALTGREREVLQLISEGHHTKEIADRLKVSPKTILAHRENTMHKLGIDSIAELTRYALREGISEL